MRWILLFVLSIFLAQSFCAKRKKTPAKPERNVIKSFDFYKVQGETEKKLLEALYERDEKLPSLIELIEQLENDTLSHDMQQFILSEIQKPVASFMMTYVTWQMYVEYLTHLRKTVDDSCVILDGNLPLDLFMISTLRGSTRLVNLIMKNKPVWLTYSKGFHSAVSLAVIGNQYRVLKKIIETLPSNYRWVMYKIFSRDLKLVDYAILADNAEILHLLIIKGVYSAADYRDSAGNSMIHVAMRFRRLKVVEYLLRLDPSLILQRNWVLGSVFESIFVKFDRNLKPIVHINAPELDFLGHLLGVLDRNVSLELVNMRNAFGYLFLSYMTDELPKMKALRPRIVAMLGELIDTNDGKEFLEIGGETMRVSKTLKPLKSEMSFDLLKKSSLEKICLFVNTFSVNFDLFTEIVGFMIESNAFKWIPCFFRDDYFRYFYLRMVKSKKGKTEVTIVNAAVIDGEIELLRVFLESHEHFFTYRDHQGKTLLHTAMIFDQRRVFEYLIDFGVQHAPKLLEWLIIQREETSGQTVVDFAISKDYFYIDCLLSKGVITLTFRSEDGGNVLHKAAESGNIDMMINLFISYSPNSSTLFLYGSEGRTLSSYAFSEWDENIAAKYCEFAVEVDPALLSVPIEVPGIAEIIVGNILPSKEASLEILKKVNEEIDVDMVKFFKPPGRVYGLEQDYNPMKKEKKVKSTKKADDIKELTQYMASMIMSKEEEVIVGVRKSDQRTANLAKALTKAFESTSKNKVLTKDIKKEEEINKGIHEEIKEEIKEMTNEGVDLEETVPDNDEKVKQEEKVFEKTRVEKAFLDIESPFPQEFLLCEETLPFLMKLCRDNSKIDDNRLRERLISINKTFVKNNLALNTPNKWIKGRKNTNYEGYPLLNARYSVESFPNGRSKYLNTPILAYILYRENELTREEYDNVVKDKIIQLFKRKRSNELIETYLILVELGYLEKDDEITKIMYDLRPSAIFKKNLEDLCVMERLEKGREYDELTVVADGSIEHGSPVLSSAQTYVWSEDIPNSDYENNDYDFQDMKLYKVQDLRSGQSESGQSIYFSDESHESFHSANSYHSDDSYDSDDSIEIILEYSKYDRIKLHFIISRGVDVVQNLCEFIKGISPDPHLFMKDLVEITRTFYEKEAAVILGGFLRTCSKKYMYHPAFVEYLEEKILEDEYYWMDYVDLWKEFFPSEIIKPSDTRKLISKVKALGLYTADFENAISRGRK
jgi:ankyrin repeat protein